MEDKKILELSNGIIIAEYEDRYYLLVDTEKLEISKEDVEIIKKYPDYAFNVIINARRKYWFNTSMDRYSPTEY